MSLQYYRALMNQGLPYETPTFSTPVTGLSGASTKWFGRMINLANYSYFAQASFATILRLDRSLETTSAVGSLGGTFKFSGAVKVDENNFVMCPNNIANPISYKESTNSIAGITTTPGCSADEFARGVLAPDGHIYLAPNRGTQFLDIDVSTGTYTSTRILSGAFSGTANKFESPVLGEDGLIYWTPSTGKRTMLEFDPNGGSPTWKEWTATFPTGGSISGHVLAFNGYGYAFERNNSGGSERIFEIDYSAESITEVATYNNNTNFLRWTLHPNGRIYAAHFDGTAGGEEAEWIEFDPYTYTLTEFNTTGTVNDQYQAAGLAPNGSIYATPYNSTSIIKLSTSIENFTNEWQVPSLSNLATSNYNKLYNN